VAEALLRNADGLVDGARVSGRVGYIRAARRAVGYTLGFRVAHLIHRSFHLDRPLANSLSRRFEALLVVRIILEELQRFNRRRMGTLVGERMVDVIDDILTLRFDRVRRLLDALQLQYPDYFSALERRFVKLSGLRLEQLEYRTLHEDGLIGQELYNSLRRTIDSEREGTDIQPRLDLNLEPQALVKRIDMFEALNEDQIDRLCRYIQPRIVVPDEVIYRRGQRSDSMFFISSGAIEVRFPGNNTLSLGPGAIVGHGALLNNEPRRADIVALNYSRILVLHAADFHSFLAENPDIRAEIDRLTFEQIQANAEVLQRVGITAEDVERYTPLAYQAERFLKPAEAPAAEPPPDQEQTPAK
jgi:CPA1 family monovalent cation:H+ antiporter